MKNSISGNFFTKVLFIACFCTPLKHQAQNILFTGSQDTLVFAYTKEEARKLLNRSFDDTTSLGGIKDTFLSEYGPGNSQQGERTNKNNPFEGLDSDYTIQRQDKKSGIYLIAQSTEPLTFPRRRFYIVSLGGAKNKSQWIEIGQNSNLEFNSFLKSGSTILFFFNFKGGIANYVIEVDPKAKSLGEPDVYYKLPNSNIYSLEASEMLYSLIDGEFKFVRNKSWYYGALKFPNGNYLDSDGNYVARYLGRKDSTVHLLDTDGVDYTIHPHNDSIVFDEYDEIFFLHGGILYTNKGEFEVLESNDLKTYKHIETSKPILLYPFAIPNFGWIGITTNNECIMVHDGSKISVPIKTRTNDEGAIQRCYTVSHDILKISFPNSHVLVISLSDGKILHNSRLNLSNGLFDDNKRDSYGFENVNYFWKAEDVLTMAERVRHFNNGNIGDLSASTFIIASGADWNNAFIDSYELGEMLGYRNTLYVEANTEVEFDELMRRVESSKPSQVIFLGHGAVGSYGHGNGTECCGGNIKYKRLRGYCFEGIHSFFAACSSSAGAISGPNEWVSSGGASSAGLNFPSGVRFIYHDGKIIGVISGSGALKIATSK